MSPTVYSPPIRTYTALATTTLSSSASSVTFSSISGSYRDLVIVANYKKADANTGGYFLMLQFNGSTSSAVYSYVRMWGENSSGYSTSGTLSGIFAGLAPSGGNVWCMARSQILDYSASDKHTTVLSRADWDDALVDENAYATACRWAVTDVVTSVKVLLSGGQSFDTGTTISLYGIEA